MFWRSGSEAQPPRHADRFLQSGRTWAKRVQGEIERISAHGARSAFSLVRSLRSLVNRTDERFCEPELYRIAGEIIFRKPAADLVAAEERFREAIKVAQKQSAKWWELRASKSLARLLRYTNRRDEARAMLAEIYSWFTEGFHTADLKDAKALLDELSNSP